jgi:hypothetical protein
MPIVASRQTNWDVAILYKKDLVDARQFSSHTYHHRYSRFDRGLPVHCHLPLRKV